jgi:hypothetical protein
LAPAAAPLLQTEETIAMPGDLAANPHSFWAMAAIFPGQPYLNLDTATPEFHG